MSALNQANRQEAEADAAMMTNEAPADSGTHQSRITSAKARYGLMRQALEAARPRPDCPDAAARVRNFLKSS